MNLKKWVIVFLVLLLIVTGYLVREGVEAYRNYRSNERMAELIREQEAQAEQDAAREAESFRILPEYAAIYEQNPEFAGWIRIPGTMLDYPVMKPEEDNDYYLDRNADGEKSKYGCIFLDVGTDLRNRKGNHILYGHYFRDGSMFGTLVHYKDESYWKEHPLIEFDTIYDKGTYEIISVFLSRVYRQNDDVFKYYKYVDITTEEEFTRYVDEVKELSLYDTGKTAAYGDRLITLSTCDYWTDNGRLVVVARETEETLP